MEGFRGIIEYKIYLFLNFEKKIKNEKHDEKSNLVFSCESYVKWPKHAVEDLLQILDWETFHENTSCLTV